MWVCVPELGAEQPTLALVWNWETNAVGFRDLLDTSSNGDTRTATANVGTPCIAIGGLDDVSVETWASDGGAWSSDSTLWDMRTTNPQVPRLLMQDRSAGKRTFLLDSGTTFDTATIPWYLERSALALSGVDKAGNPVSDTEMVKLLTEIWPRFECEDGVVITMNVGTQDAPNSAVSWSEDYSFTMGTDIFQSVYHSSKYLSVRFSNTGDKHFRMLGYDLELSPDGYF
jgi:hypothetical protein